MRYRPETLRCPETASFPAITPTLTPVYRGWPPSSSASAVSWSWRGPTRRRRRSPRWPGACSWSGRDCRRWRRSASSRTWPRRPGIPVTEMAAAVLRQEPPAGPGRFRGRPPPTGPIPPAWPGRASGSGAGEWLEPGQRLDGGRRVARAGGDRPRQGRRRARRRAGGPARAEVRGGRGRGLAARRRRRARAARPGRPRRHRLEPLAAAAAAVRLPGAAGGGRRRRPVVGGRAAAVRPGRGRGAVGTERRPGGARAPRPGGHPPRRGRGLVARAATGVRRRHQGPAGGDGGRLRRRARRAPRLRAHRGGDAVARRLRRPRPDRGLGAAGPAAARPRRARSPTSRSCT